MSRLTKASELGASHNEPFSDESMRILSEVIEARSLAGKSSAKVRIAPERQSNTIYSQICLFGESVYSFLNTKAEIEAAGYTCELSGDELTVFWEITK